MLVIAFSTPTPSVPFGTLGTEVGIGAVFLIHISVVGFILGATAITPFMELSARRTGNEMHMRYARKLGHSILYLYSFGATWAAFAVVLLTGLYGRLIGTLLNILLLPLTIAFSSFFIGIPLLLLYTYGWDKLAPKLHLAVGFAFALVQYAFLFMIVQLDAFVLDPGTADSARNLGFSPSYPWLLLHYAAGTISWAALLLAGIAVWRAWRATNPGEAEFQRWAARVNFAIGSIFLMAQPITGYLLADSLKNTAAPTFDNLFIFNSGTMFIGQVVLLAVIVVGANLVFWMHREGGDSSFNRTLTIIALLGMAGTALPAAVIPTNLVTLRYVALGIAFLATLGNLVAYVRGIRREGATMRIGRPAGAIIGVVGICALVLSIYMGVIKENAKLPCAIDSNTGQSACLLSLHQARQNFVAPRGDLP